MDETAFSGKQMEQLAKLLAPLRQGVGEMDRRLDEIGQRVEDMAKRLEALENTEAQLSAAEARARDADTLRVYEQTIAALGPDGYRPTKQRTTTTGASIIEPVQDWRRRPGY